MNIHTVQMTMEEILRDAVHIQADFLDLTLCLRHSTHAKGTHFYLSERDVCLRRAPTIARRLTALGLEITECCDPNKEYADHKVASDLGFFIAQRFERLAPFWLELRANLHGRRFFFPLAGCSGQLISDIIHVCNHLEQLGHLRFDYARKQVVAVKVIRNPATINYITGGWFELAMLRLLKTLNPSESERLVRVKSRHEKGAFFEFDILFIERGVLRMLECKSGIHFPEHDSSAQIRRAVNVLRLNANSSAIVVPKMLPKEQAYQLEGVTGSQVISFDRVQDFLKG